MRLSALMAVLDPPNPDYMGVLTNDDAILAVDISEGQDVPVGDFVVAQAGLEGVEVEMNPVTDEKVHIRAGASTTKTGTQRTFKITGDRYVGDSFQDYAFSIDQLYGVGQKVIVRYVWFNSLTGKGEMGRASILVNSDGGGNAGETAAIDVELRKTGEMPTAFAWQPQP